MARLQLLNNYFLAVITCCYIDFFISLPFSGHVIWIKYFSGIVFCHLLLVRLTNSFLSLGLVVQLILVHESFLLKKLKQQKRWFLLNLSKLLTHIKVRHLKRLHWKETFCLSTVAAAFCPKSEYIFFSSSTPRIRHSENYLLSCNFCILPSFISLGRMLVMTCSVY